MRRKIVVDQSTITAGQMKDFWDKVGKGVIHTENFGRFLESPRWNADLPLSANGGAAGENPPRPTVALQELGPRFTAPLGEFNTPQELIAALNKAGLAYIEPYVCNTLLPSLELCQEAGTVGGYPVMPLQVGNQRTTLFRDFYDTQLPNYGFVRPVREYGALLILKLARQLKDTGDCCLKVGEHFVVLSAPLKVDGDGVQYFLSVDRSESGLRLDFDWFLPDDEVDLVRLCLSTRM